MPFYISAQTGPAGIRNSSSNELWLVVEDNCYTDAGTTAGTNNSSIQQWNDISGNDYHAIQTNSTFQPTLLTNQVNGHSVLRFDASNSRILSSGLPGSSSRLIVYGIIKMNSLANNNDGIIQASPTGTAFTTNAAQKTIGMWVNSSSGNIWGRGVEADGNRVNLPQNQAISSGQFYMVAQEYDGSNVNQYVDGALVGSVAYDGTLLSWEEFGIGRQATESMDGDFAELIVYNDNLNNAEKIILENYLSGKYGLSLAANDIYVQDDGANGDFDFEIAGIGQASDGTSSIDGQGTGAVRISNPSNLDNDEFLFWGHNNAPYQGSEYSDIPTGIQARLKRTWRVNEVSSAGASIDIGNIDLSFDLSGLGSVTAADLGLLIDTDNDGSFSDETAIFGASNTSGSVFEFSAVTDISNGLRFTLGTADRNQTTLPVELISFESRAVDNSAVLHNWVTASEINNDYFSLERSKDGLNWEEIARIQGNGNSSSIQHYTCTDEHPNATTLYYRLRQTDFDGSAEYVGNSIVHLEWDIPVLRAFPNPSNGLLTIELSPNSFENVIIELRDPVGALIYRSREISETSVWRKELFIDRKGVFSISVKYGQERFNQLVVVI
ncbi:MAG: LamG-like jellyroll fold domain-containing protein [Bacteroidota bacterium]